MAAQAVRLLGDSAAREQLVEAGRTRVREFDWDVVVDDVIAVYESVGMPGEKVTTDIRGQIVGRLGMRPVS